MVESNGKKNENKSSESDGRAKIMEQIKSGEVVDLSPRKQDPWQNILDLIQGGFCDPKKGRTRKRSGISANNVGNGLSAPSNEEEETQDSTNVTATETDEMERSDMDAVNEVKNEAQESSQQTWNSGPRNDTVANVEEMQNTPDMDDKEENEIKPKSILKKRSPGPVVTEKKNTFNAIFMALIMLAVLASKYYFHGTNFSAAPPVSDVEKSRGDVPRVVNLETYESTEGEPVDAVDEIENEGAVVKETTDDVSIDIKDEAPDIPNTVQDEIPSQKTDEDVSVEVHETNSKEDTSVMQESRQVDSDIVIESDDVEVDTEDTGVSTKETSQEAGAGKLVEDEAFQTKIDEDLEVKLDVEDISENEEEHESLDEEVVDVLKADINEMQNNYQATVNDVTISNENDENSSLEQIQDETEIGSQDDLVAKLQNQIESNPDAEIEEKPKAQFIKVFGQAGQIVKKKAQSMAKAISPQIQKGLKSRKPAIKKLQKQIEPTLKKFDPAAKRVQKKVTSVFNGINPARKRKADIS